MAKLTEALGLTLGSSTVILVGKPEITNIMDSDDKPYYIARLKEPVTVRCSVDPDIEAFETEEVYLRESAVGSEDWEFVNPKKPAEGYFMKNWVVDYSKSQRIPLYQETTIKRWSRGNRATKRDEARDSINRSIREKMEAKRKAAEK